MFALDPKLQSRLRQHMSRVLILEGNPAYARMLADMLRVLGCDNIVIESDDRKGMAMLPDFDPQLIMTEYKTATIDGIAFTRDLRRSQVRAKAVPVLMMKSEVTAEQLNEARNAGIHEVLAKPFAWQDLLTRLQNVLFKPREWIEVSAYVGPCRRSFNTGNYKGQKKRRGDNGGLKIAVEEAVRLLRASLDIFDEDVNAATTSIMQQMQIIVPACKMIRNPKFTHAVAAVVQDLRAKALSRTTLEPQVMAMMEGLGMDKAAAANRFANKLFGEDTAEAGADEGKSTRSIAEDVHDPRQSIAI
ncbi:response regulator [Asticcacaulis sp. EMRT-3]|uniref:response regulator n=1 Tax=Asticcacaulis sp. EMRT-3 TaxID=3040349 RepID=UPI0024AF2A69|nr:response regulator [Asticcacaulis sp. EMRT-3]MDI7773734.1 response regulator [Asticcacaulis sp. EMRT-3]